MELTPLTPEEAARMLRRKFLNAASNAPRDVRVVLRPVEIRVRAERQVVQVA